MSIRKHATLRICCDGPCGTVIEGSTPNLPRVPLDWNYVDVNVQYQDGKQLHMKERSLLCSKCFATFKHLLHIGGFAFSPGEKIERQPEGDPTAVRMGGERR